ncbi:MAG: thioredoxin family protein [Chitinophagaceae bacterium]|nr:MAG: thioredoxin family protein [Chitinophagaceae bacterium]
MKRLTTLFFALLTAGIASGQQWNSDFALAQAQAKASGKNILLVFSGSDWCAPCIRLDKSVWQSEAFKLEAANWTLVKADFPKKKNHALSPELTAANAKLCETYNPEGNFPLVVMLDPSGKVIGKMGYLDVPASEYIQKIHGLLK